MKIVPNKLLRTFKRWSDSKFDERYAKDIDLFASWINENNIPWPLIDEIADNLADRYSYTSLQVLADMGEALKGIEAIEHFEND